MENTFSWVIQLSVYLHIRYTWHVKFYHNLQLLGVISVEQAIKPYQHVHSKF